MPTQQPLKMLTTRSVFLRVFIVVITIVFLNEALQLYGPHAHPVESVTSHVIENIIFIICSGPLLWFAIAWPLQRLLTRQHAQTQVILTDVLEAIITVDHSGLITGCNPAAESIFAATASELVGHHAGMLFEGGETVCLPFLETALTGHGRSERKTPCFREMLGRRTNGDTFEMEVSFSPVSAGGYKDIFLLVRDVSARVTAQKTIAESEARFLQIFELAQKVMSESEVRFRQIFEQSADAIFIFDADCKLIMDMNQVASRMFGYSKEELLDTSPDFLLNDNERRAVYRQAVSLNNESGYWVDIMQARKKDGTALYVSVRCRLISLGEQNALLCTVRDISERVRAEKEARAIEAKLIQANKMTSLGVLVSGIAHEINNPNNFIMISSELLSRSWKDARPVLAEYHSEHPDFALGGVSYATMEGEIQGLLENITDGARRIRDIVNELKEFARDGGSAMRSDVDLNRVIAQATTIISHQIHRYTNSFHVDAQPDLPLVVGNPQQLEQVIINLLLNALQALPDKERSVRIRSFFDRDAQTACIEVHDQGSGIAEGVGPRIMETFFTTKRDSGGTGLGLSISQSIVRDHNGTLTFSSAPDTGTVFCMRIPVPHNPEVQSR